MLLDHFLHRRDDETILVLGVSGRGGGVPGVGCGVLGTRVKRGDGAAGAPAQGGHHSALLCSGFPLPR